MVEITATDGRNMLIGNHYFFPDIKVDIIKNYFRFVENILDVSNDSVILRGNFNVPELVGSVLLKTVLSTFN
jgi:hypothetical protein